MRRQTEKLEVLLVGLKVALGEYSQEEEAEPALPPHCSPAVLFLREEGIGWEKFLAANHCVPLSEYIVAI